MSIETPIHKYEYLKFKHSLHIEYLLLQEKYSNIYNKDKTIVLMQVGGFHECYATKTRGYNLHKLGNLLKTVVSKKNKKIQEVSESNPYMIGFPIIATPKYIQMLVNYNFHVIKIDQVTDKPAPKRAITAIYSPGTYIDEINTQDSKYILSVFIEEIKQLNNTYILHIGLSIVDLSIGKSIIHEVFANKEDDKYSLDETLKFIYNFNPVETVIHYRNLITYTEDELISYLELKNTNCLVYEYKTSKEENIEYQNNLLKEVFNCESYLSPIEDLDLEILNVGRLSYILLLEYCKKQISDILSNIQKPEFYNNLNYLHLGNNALKQLDVINNKSDEKNDSLFDIVNYTNTSMGRRYLKFNLCNPLCNSDRLNDRYDKIQEILIKKMDLSENLKNILDIERIHRKISLRSLNPFDFVNLNDCYEIILSLYEDVKDTKLNSIFTECIKEELENFIDYYSQLFDFNEMSKYNLIDIDGSFFKVSINKDIDTLQDKINNDYKLIENIRDLLDHFIESKKRDYFNSNSEDKTSIQINYNDKDKYYLSLTTKRGEMVKKGLKNKKSIKVNNISVSYDSFSFKSQTSSMKITCEFIDKLSNSITLAKDKLIPLVKNTYQNYLSEFYGKFNSLFLKLNQVISEIDFLNSGALCSTKNCYSKPRIIESENSFIEVKKMRHPIQEKLIFNKYIPHNIILGKEEIGILLYGLNASGKSSLMKSVGLNIILAQIGYYVPAEKFNYNPYTSIFTRIINTDNMYKGLSSFALELVELKAILKRSGNNTLVLADEVCSGTEYKSALIIVATMLKMLLNSKTTFISATHLHELTTLESVKKLQNIGVYHISVKYENDNIIFDRKLNKGNGKEEYGLDFAKYIIKDQQFLEIAGNIKNEIEGVSNKIKKSKYNKDVIIEKCDICECKDNLETHHIEFQKNANELGFILKDDKKHIHKDHTSNLVILCSTCHDKIHNNLIVIEGYEETLKGNILKFNYVDMDKKEKNLKYSDNEINFILEYKNKKFTQKKVKTIFESKNNKKISTTTIKKIWENAYK
tara:strand:+ start:141 stop:3251 length:3111 start_codon:yes stop_codon:yes gene_type:complete